MPCRPNQLEELDAAVGEQLESGGASRCRWGRGVHPAEVGTGERNPQGLGVLVRRFIINVRGKVKWSDFFWGAHEIHIWMIIVDSWTCGMNHFKFISAINIFEQGP